MATPVKIIYNLKDETWHPILYRESPLPGNPENILRFKSSGHHTVGFKSREDAINDINSDYFKSRLDSMGSYPVYLIDEDILWDGEGIPADIILLSPSQIHTN